MLEITLSVGELNEYVRTLLEGDALLSSLRLRGEISNFKRHSSGHLYFSLKDASSVIRCVCFRQNAQALRFSPRDGLGVVARGYVSLFPRDGAYQFYCEGMEPDGVGALYALFEETKARLAKKGYFDQTRKRPLPANPRCVGVVTSETGAVIRDIIRVARRRNPGIGILLAPCRVQGEGAEMEIAEGIRSLQDQGVDLIICGRGGGSFEDLWCFNEEIVARAIFESKLPVISAIGHETDFSIADFVADIRASTPSQAAELAVPDLSSAMLRLDSLMARLNLSASRELALRGQRLAGLRQRLSPAGLSASLALRGERLRGLNERLNFGILSLFERKAQALGGLNGKLPALNPDRVLERGYAIVTGEDGRALHAPPPPGSQVLAKLSGGSFRARVLQRAEKQRQIGFLDEVSEDAKAD
ncbi:MAG: exodeoxyribonuclease VII large subunit [Christensenellaceae bacterium]|jgi:exodeoxyribonuclease VII large subunit|nr:exodeoxyribonuclease VII large subunit [Christensenellaceae bacterium]